MGYSIAFRTYDGLPVVALGGEIDSGACPDLEARILSAATEHSARVILDLSDVTYMESRPFGTILVASRRLDGLGGGLSLVVPEGNVRRLFHASGLDADLALFDGLAAASAHLLTSSPAKGA
jgi:anti-anti-sigma factor